MSCSNYYRNQIEHIPQDPLNIISAACPCRRQSLTRAVSYDWLVMWGYQYHRAWRTWRARRKWWTLWPCWHQHYRARRQVMTRVMYYCMVMTIMTVMFVIMFPLLCKAGSTHSKTCDQDKNKKFWSHDIDDFKWERFLKYDNNGASSLPVVREFPHKKSHRWDGIRSIMLVELFGIRQGPYLPVTQLHSII